MKTYFSKLSVGVFFKDTHGTRFVRIAALDDHGDPHRLYAGNLGDRMTMNAVALDSYNDFPPGCVLQFAKDEYVEIIPNPLLNNNSN